MAWPTTSVNTTNLDAGTDNPANARGDIKQMADNVNDMQNMITMSGVSDDDILQYSSAQAKFIPTAAATFLSGAVQIAVINLGTNNTSSGSVVISSETWYRINLTETVDPSGMFSITSNKLVFANTGNYLIMPTHVQFQTGDPGDVAITVNNETPTSAAVTSGGMDYKFFAQRVSNEQSQYAVPQIFLADSFTASDELIFWNNTSGVIHNEIIVFKY